MGRPFDFGSAAREASEQGLVGGGDYLKLREGDNRFRLVSECLPHPDTYKGESRFKWLTQVIDRRDGKLKAMFMAHKIYKAIEALQLDPEYAFTEVPLPYDLNVQAKNAGTKNVEYTVVPARRNVPLTAEELERVAAEPTVQELQKKLREKKAQELASEGPAPSRVIHSEYGPDITDDDIPFGWVIGFVIPALAAAHALAPMAG